MAKKDIHPTYQEITITCTTCHTDFKVGSTLKRDVKIDTCSTCHPFYTGNQTYSNVKGRVEKFKTKFAKQAELKAKSTIDSEKQKAENLVNKKS